MNPYQLMLLKVWTIAYLVNALWQLPLIYAAAWMIAQIVRPISSRIEHRTWVGAFFAQILVPAFQVDFADVSGVVSKILAPFGLLPHTATGAVWVEVGLTQTTPSGLHIPSALSLTIAITYAASLIFFTFRLTWGLFTTQRLARQAQPLSAANRGSSNVELNDKLTRFIRHFKLNQLAPIQLATSDSIVSPITFGLFTQALIFPTHFLENAQDADLDAVLAHECAHIYRRDYAKNILYDFLSLPVAFHPMLRLTRTRLAETRELVCDALAADAVLGREQYAQALLRLATLMVDQLNQLTKEAAASTFHAIGIFDANIFERRVMRLTEKPIQLTASRRYAIIAATFVLACGTFASALAFKVAISPASVQAVNPRSIHVQSDNMKIVSKVDPVYPDAAKRSKIQGAVVLAAIIGKDGNVENLKIISGHKELQSSALDAVRQWKWEPYHLNGEPIEVKTDITVVYALAK